MTTWVRAAVHNVRTHAEELVWWSLVGLLVVCPIAYELGCMLRSR